ncbi:MAG: GntR family transcriptional regulator [Hamadaea sp.]|uniref:GntR family transcriptional regulator n=1 Tax=Hamadaea sp. TaxID=2024425 RepID=UPI0018242AE9|nr:GntR family transcriptional regulator [Hamadaea sp.]NUR49083.1 GntR family transcriptional regulator [Hamadaea sp.]NUR70822.1 GntR family transcriptional regulator [Hamadaea sp.]NUT19928.1 GntR family transcriptional regulator [Hamadaea sp.]
MGERTTLSDEVYETLKAMIMDNVIAPGGRVTIDAISRQLDVSPTPVREALARLESDGLVVKRPMAGYTTAPLLTPAEFEHLFEVRMVLECAAAARAARSGDPTVKFPRMPTPTADPGYAGHAAFTAADAAFHDAVAVAAGNPVLRESIARLHSHLHIHRVAFPGPGSTDLEHEAIVSAIRVRDPEAAEAAMHAHLTAARDRHRMS